MYKKKEKSVLTPEIKSEIKLEYLCKTCKFNHLGNLDGPGYGHWPFALGSKAETQYNSLLSQPKLPIFIPLESQEKPGILETCILNGLKIAVFKGAYVDVPRQVAEVLRDSLNQTARIPFEIKTSPNPFTGIQNPANLNLRSETDKLALNA